MGHTWCPDFVISWWDALGVQILSFRFFCGVHSSGGFGASGCIWLSVCWLCVPLGWGDRLSTPKSRLHHRRPRVLRRKRDCTHPLPHILEIAILLVSGDFGGGRIGTSPFLLTLPVCTSEGEGQAFSLTSTSTTSKEEGQDLLLTFDGKFLKCAVVTQLGRSGDTMICVKGTLCTRVQIGTARDVLRHHAAGVWC